MVFLFALYLQVQTVDLDKSQQPAPAPAALERIRRGLERPGLEPIEHPDVPVFRVYVRERPLPPQRLWTDETMRPSYVRTRAPAYHHDFLESVAPDEFRAGTLFPIGVDVIPMISAGIKAIQRARREHAEAEARRVVREELKQLLEARAEAGKDR